MPKLTRSNLTASFVVHGVVPGATKSNEYVTKRSSVNMHAGRALRELHLFYEIRKIELDALTEPALYGRNFFGAKKYAETGNFTTPGGQPRIIQIPDYTVDAQISSITYALSRTDLVELVPYSDFVPDADSKLMCVFIKETLVDSIAINQSLGTITATIITTDGITAKCVGELYAQEAYTGTNPLNSIPYDMEAGVSLWYGTEEVPVNPPVNKTIVKWKYNGPTQTGFQIYASSNGTSNWSLRGTVASTELSFVDVETTSRLFYKVRAKNGAAYFSFGDVVVAEAIHTTTPIAPTTLKACIHQEALMDGYSSSSIRLSWLDKSLIGQGGEVTFDIDFKNGAGSWEYFRNIEANATEYIGTQTLSFFGNTGDVIKFRICATNSIGSSTWAESNVVIIP